MIKVSVIVPVYNGEKYIRRCLASLFRQTLNDIEVIVIDDGSTDTTAEIVLECQKSYMSSLQFYKNNENVGLGSSRNVGLQYAQGEYVIFVDADDWVEPEYCERLYSKARENGADIVYCGYVSESEKGDVISKFVPLHSDGEMSVPFAKEVFCDNLHSTISYWSQLVKREIYTETGFRCLDGANYDEDYILLCLPFICEKIAVVDKPLYHWIQREESMSNAKISHVNDRIKVANEVVKMAQLLEVFEGYKEEWEYYYVLNVLICSMYDYEDKKIYAEFPYREAEALYSIVKQQFPFFLDNKYLLNGPFENICQKIRMLGKGEDYFYREYYAGDAEFNIMYTKKISSLFKRYEGRIIAIWGAGRKGEAFLHAKHEGVNSKIKYIIDKKSDLNGKSMLGIPIVSVEQLLLERKIDVIFVMNHKYVKNIKEQMNLSGIDVIDLEAQLLFE